MADSAIPLRVTTPEFTTQAFSYNYEVPGYATSVPSTTIDVSKSGYNPIGIAGVSTINSVGNYYIRGASLSGTTLSIGSGYVSNPTHTTTVRATVTIVYIKN